MRPESFPVWPSRSLASFCPEQRNQRGIKPQFAEIRLAWPSSGDGAMLFPDWVAITVLVLLLVGAASAWLRQHKSALMQQTKKPRFSKRTAEEWRDWSYTKERIGQQLKAYYHALATEELPPRLLAILKKFDEETEPSAEQVRSRLRRQP